MGQYGISWAIFNRQEKPSENRGLANLRMASVELGLGISGTNQKLREAGKYCAQTGKRRVNQLFFVCSYDGTLDRQYRETTQNSTESKKRFDTLAAHGRLLNPTFSRPCDTGSSLYSRGNDDVAEAVQSLNPEFPAPVQEALECDIDFAQLEDLATVLPAAAMRELMASFDASFKAAHGKLNAAAAIPDLEAAGCEAHDLKSITGNFGLRRLQHIAQQIEGACALGRAELEQSPQVWWI